MYINVIKKKHLEIKYTLSYYGLTKVFISKQNLVSIAYRRVLQQAWTWSIYFILIIDDIRYDTTIWLSDTSKIYLKLNDPIKLYEVLYKTLSGQFHN